MFHFASFLHVTPHLYPLSTPGAAISEAFSVVVD
jgi:hypothetical protein